MTLVEANYVVGSQTITKMPATETAELLCEGLRGFGVTRLMVGRRPDLESNRIGEGLVSKTSAGNTVESSNLSLSAGG